MSSLILFDRPWFVSPMHMHKKQGNGLSFPGKLGYNVYRKSLKWSVNIRKPIIARGKRQQIHIVKVFCTLSTVVKCSKEQQRLVFILQVILCSCDTVFQGYIQIIFNNYYSITDNGEIEEEKTFREVYSKCPPPFLNVNTISIYYEEKSFWFKYLVLYCFIYVSI